MNRDKALSIADRIMTRIETDRAIHKDAIADEIQAGDALPEVIDIISHDGKQWVHRDGTAFDVNADQVKPAPVRSLQQPSSVEEIQRLREQYRNSLNASFYYMTGIR